MLEVKVEALSECVIEMTGELGGAGAALCPQTQHSRCTLRPLKGEDGHGHYSVCSSHLRALVFGLMNRRGAWAE